MQNLDNDVMIAILKLSRALRRCPPERKESPFPPAVGRLLECAAANANVSSRELCEVLDVRPSSLSEMLARAEKEGLLSRTADETDRRVQRVALTEKGRRAVTDMEEARNRDAAKKTACLTDEEKAQFCALCNRLSEHIEGLALDLPEGMQPRSHGPGKPPCGPGEGRPHDPGRDGAFPGGPRCPVPEEGDVRESEGRPPLPPGGRYRS